MVRTMASVIENIAAFDAMRAQLESEHLGEWVVFHDRSSPASIRPWSGPPKMRCGDLVAGRI